MSHPSYKTLTTRTRASSGKLWILAQLIVSAVALTVLNGCGGGYAGGIVPGLSASRVTIDSGQSFMAVANNPQSLPLNWALSGSTCTAGGCGTISEGTAAGALYTAPQVSKQITVTLRTTVMGTSAASSTTIVINPAPQITGSAQDATVGVPYSTTFALTGGTPALKWLPAKSTLPAGLSFDTTTGILAGTPTVAGNSTFTLQAIDSSDVPFTVSATFTVNVSTGAMNPPALSATGSTPDGTVNTPYSTILQASGGSAPYRWNIANGSLPAGLNISTSGVISGTPSAAGTFTFTAQVTDAKGATATLPLTLKVQAASQQPTLTLTNSTLPSGTVQMAYAASITITGGNAPYTCSADAASLPAGLTLGSNCAVTGIPTTPGTVTFTVHATDASSPAITGTGLITIVINPAPAVLTIASPPAATVGLPYSGAISVTGGVAPYHCVLASGTMPATLTLGADCVVRGLPLVAGTTSIGVTATDSANPANTTTATVTITVQAPIITLTITAPPMAVVGVPYTGVIVVAGGTPPYQCSQASGTLPNGLTLGSDCVITGTPTTPGTATVGITVTDSADPANTKTTTITITVEGSLITLTLTAPPVAVVHVPYVGVILVAGGTAPYQCTLASGTLPDGINLGSNCILTGTPTAAGTSTVHVTVTDSASPTNTSTAPITITVLGLTSSLTISSPTDATVNTPYSAIIPVTGGTAPYQCNIVSGNLPAGLTLGTNCSITGTPTVVGTSMLNVQATDSASLAVTGTANVSVTVRPLDALTLTGTLPNAILGVPYTQTLHATGGIAPYTYTYTGALPAGLSLSTGGVISGTPTAIGASSFTVTATDSQATPQTASLPLTLQVVYPTTPYDVLLKGPYAFLFQGYDDVAAGVLAYQTATIGSFTADGNGLLTVGELDSNHQSSNPAGNTVAMQNLLGTYTVGQDGRGTIAITTLGTDGTASATATYAIALKLPTGSAAAASSGSLTEADGSLLVGTKGSGTLLAQTASAYSTGLSGNYAFGLSGDTPCLPSCTIGLVAGPAASVGQFTATGGSVSGVSDTNISTTNYTSSALSGALTTADNNGRIQLTLNNAKLASLAYPTHYAVYLVDASHAFLMSTDKHSAYVLQAGTAQLQTAGATFNGPYVGYENAPVNPGLVNTTLSNVLNLSSATIFRGTGNNNGTCTTTNVDVGGLTGLVSSLTGLGSNSTLLNAVLGTYQSLGNSTCSVANGRAVLAYPNPNTLLSTTLRLLGLGNDPPQARVVYLTGNNEGYFLETGYAALGHISAQTGAPFTVSSLHGTYVYSTVPASSLVTIDSTGSFTADGAGHTTSTLDNNVGVGNVNLLQLGTTGSASYSLTDSTAGRYLLGGTRVIYALSPDRYVLLETSALSTAPYVAQLY